MNVIDTRLKGVLIIEPKVFGDERGFFKETFQTERYQEIGIDLPFVQDNLSRSQKGVCGSISRRRGHKESLSVAHEAQCGTSCRYRPEVADLWHVCRHRAKRSEPFAVMGTAGICTRVLCPERVGGF